MSAEAIMREHATAILWELERLDHENRQLRAWLSSLVWWVWQRQELRELAEAEIAKRWPS